MLKRASSYLPLILLALTLVVVHYRLLLGEVFFWGLPSLQFYPWREYAFSLLRAGQLPLWNPLNGAGAPLFANYQSALLYPFNWIGAILPLAQTMSLSAVLHLFIGGWGMWRLMGRLGANDIGRGISAFAFGVASYLVARLGTFPIINAAVWLPWQIWAAHDLLTTGRRRAGAWLALFTALQLLAGHAQTAWYSLGLVGLFVFWFMFSQRPFVWRRLVAVIGCIALGAGVAGLQLLATAELLGQSQRSGGVDMWTAMNFSYGPARTLNFLSPLIFGTPADGSYLTQGAYFEDAVYIGLIPLVAAIAAIVGWRRRRGETLAQSIPFWIVIIFIGFVLALGQYSPVFPFLYEHVPTFDLFQAPVRWHLWTVFGLSVLAGIGATWWRRGGRWTRRLTVACGGAALVAFAMMLFLPSDNPGVKVLIRAVLVTSLFGAAAGWLTLGKSQERSPRYSRWTIMVFVVLALDLGLASWGLNPTVPAAFYSASGNENDASSREYIPREVERALKFDQYFRFDDYNIAAQQWQQVRQLNLPNTNMLDRLSLLNNFDPLLPAQYVRYINLLENNLHSDNLFAAAAVNEVREQADTARQINEQSQRAYVVGSVCWHETQTELEAAMLDPQWQPAQQAHILGDRGCESAATGAPGSVTGAHYEANRVILTVEMQRDGWLVLSDTDYPGWAATVDGEATPIYRANVMFRAVQVSAGEHRVHFDYNPDWLMPGALISSVSLLIVLLLFRLKSVTPPYN